MAYPIMYLTGRETMKKLNWEQIIKENEQEIKNNKVKQTPNEIKWERCVAQNEVELKNYKPKRFKKGWII